VAVLVDDRSCDVPGEDDDLCEMRVVVSEPVVEAFDDLVHLLLRSRVTAPVLAGLHDGCGREQRARVIATDAGGQLSDLGAEPVGVSDVPVAMSVSHRSRIRAGLALQ
jgi:hypothetical protein